MRSVTVVMSSYNGEKYITEQIESILAQKGCSVSLIVRDDGSCDDTVKILKDYQKKGKLMLVQGGNLKPARSFLEALKHTGETEYYAFSDQDDIWMDDKLSIALSILEDFDVGTPNLYCSNLTAVDNKYNILSDKLLPDKIVTDYKELLVRSPHIFGCTCVFNRAMRDYVVERPLPQKLIMHDLWIALIASSIGNLYYDKTPHIKYRQHGNNHTGAVVSIKEKMKNRLAIITGNTTFLISPQAEEFIQYAGEKELRKVGLLEYSQVVANYKKSIRNKVIYIKTVEHKSMTRKQYLFHILMILAGRL